MSFGSVMKPGASAAKRLAPTRETQRLIHTSDTEDISVEMEAEEVSAAEATAAEEAANLP